MIYKNAINLKVDGYIIKRLNYIDLQILIYSLSIDEVKQALKQRRNQQLAEKGIKEVKQATNEDINKL